MTEDGCLIAAGADAVGSDIDGGTLLAEQGEVGFSCFRALKTYDEGCYLSVGVHSFLMKNEE